MSSVAQVRTLCQAVATQLRICRQFGLFRGFVHKKVKIVLNSTVQSDLTILLHKLHDQKMWTSFGSNRVAHYMQISPHEFWNEDNGNLLA